MNPPSSPLPYQDPTLSPEVRTADLIGRMTLEEKAAQLVTPPPNLENADGSLNPEVAREALKDGVGFVGSHHVRRGLDQTVAWLNEVQRFLREETRLGIPALAVGEGLHGYMANEATNFPQAIALASTWDPVLVERVFEVTAREMRARGVPYALSPVLDLARDPRWGRTEETYGEDPYLTARLGVAAVRGLQGREFTAAPDRVLATAKHFAAHGQPESGTNAGPMHVSERMLREQLLVPFQAVVEEAGIQSVMASYNEINGVPSHINPWLLKDVLRGEWGFDGWVISDGWGVDDLYRLHLVAENAQEAAQRAFSSGVDLELGRCFLSLPTLVRDGAIPEAALDTAVARLLSRKFQLGLFENPFVDGPEARRITNGAPHQALALEAARRSIILLKNDQNLLPLKAESLNCLAVIGPNAAALRLGGYSGQPGNGVTVLAGLRRYAADRFQVVTAPGCGITQSTNEVFLWHDDEVLAPEPAQDEALIAEAVTTAQAADVVLLVLGDNEQSCREGWSMGHLGDRDSLDLPGRQDDLLRAVVATGKPVVLLLLHGRPASIGYAVDNVPAILEGWYLGQSTGTAVAEVLFGDTNPGGKLPITIPRSVGQIPAYYSHQPSARRGYVLGDKTPLFPFGHGLSYTRFRYSGLRLSAERMAPEGAVDLEVEVTNDGHRDGDEVVQLYVRDTVSSLPRPVKELRGFQRISLKAGETRTVRFTVSPSTLSFLNAGMERVVELGFFDLMVGGSSAEVQTIRLEVR